MIKKIQGEKYLGAKRKSLIWNGSIILLHNECFLDFISCQGLKHFGQIRFGTNKVKFHSDNPNDTRNV